MSFLVTALQGHTISLLVNNLIWVSTQISPESDNISRDEKMEHTDTDTYNMLKHVCFLHKYNIPTETNFCKIIYNDPLSEYHHYNNKL